MERYLRRNRLSDVMDSLGMVALLYLAAAGWFIWLWGLTLPALLAGMALGTLFVMGRRQWRKANVDRREKALRSRIGAELMLEAMLLSEAKEAHFRAALLLAEKWPITMQSVREEGVLCLQGKETLLIQCLRMPPEGELSMGDLLSAQRAVKRLQADRAVLCVLGKAGPKIAARAEEALVPLRIVRRETLLSLAGQLSPATDEQLVELGKRKRRPPGNLRSLVFRADKARRYLCYGLLMLILYILSSARIYAVPGMVCLTMAAVCRCGRKGYEAL